MQADASYTDQNNNKGKTCLFNKKGLFSIFVQNRLNSPKVTKKELVFRKVARSCSPTKKVAQNPKSC